MPLPFYALSLALCLIFNALPLLRAARLAAAADACRRRAPTAARLLLARCFCLPCRGCLYARDITRILRLSRNCSLF
eukprot:1190663-Pleurochrysis_carterae.AAC.6